MAKGKTWVGRVYLGRDETGRQEYRWIGRFSTRRERDQAVAEARVAIAQAKDAALVVTCDQWADRYLERAGRLVQERKLKASSLDTARVALKRLRETFGPRPLDSISPVEAEDWAGTVPTASIPQVVALFNYAMRMQIVAHNPFDGLGRGSRGRAHDAPPTVKQLAALRLACDVHKGYAQQLRDLMDFAALTLMRPSELYELRHTDVDLVANRIHVTRRVYRGKVDTPKNGRAKTIALVPPARAILVRQPTRAREDGLVFVGKQGNRLTAATMSAMWRLVNASAGLDFAFYLATKHYGVHELYKLGLSRRAIAAQAGWSESDVDQMLRVYGHQDLVALAEVDALYASDGASITARETT